MDGLAPLDECKSNRGDRFDRKKAAGKARVFMATGSRGPAVSCRKMRGLTSYPATVNFARIYAVESGAVMMTATAVGIIAGTFLKARHVGDERARASIACGAATLAVMPVGRMVMERMDGGRRQEVPRQRKDDRDPFRKNHRPKPGRRHVRLFSDPITA
jgi:hypothetical protein